MARTESISDGAVSPIAASTWTAEREASAAGIEPRTVALLAVLVAGSILLRVPFLSVPMITDEGGYSYTAKFWSSEYQLYRDIPFDRPQAIFLLYRLAFAIFGTDVTAVRSFAAVYNGLTVAAMFLLCRRTFSSRDRGEASLREAWLAGLLFAVFSVSPRIEGFTANAETFMLLPLVVSAHLTWNRQWLGAGFAAAMAVLLKPSGASAVLLILSWLLLTRAAPGAWLRAGSGIALGLSGSLLHGLWVGWGYYWQSIHERRLILYNPETVGLSAQWKGLVNGLTLTVSSWAFPAVAALLGALRSRSRQTVFGLLWLGFSVVGVAMGGWWREHYFIQLVPPLVFLASAGLARLATSPLRLAWSVALFFALALFARRDVVLGFQSPDSISWEVYERPGYLLQNQIAAYLRDVTGEDDTIYVAFAEAELYYLSGRRAAVPQFYYLHAQYSKSVFDSIVEAIRERRPAVVLVVQSPPENQMSSRDFFRLLDAGYARDRTFSIGEDISPIVAFRRREGASPQG